MLNISSTSSTLSTLFGTQTLDELKKSQEAGQATGQTTSQTTGLTGAASALTAQDTDQAKVSQFGQLMSKLQQMSSTDQDAFKATAQTIADNLTQSASESTDPTQKEAFAYISSKFAEAAKTGDMSSLKDVGQAMLGVSGTASSGAAGGDTVTISSEGKDLAAKDDSASSESGGSGSSDSSGSSGADADASGTSEAKAAGGGGGGSSSSSSDDSTVSDLEDEIDDMKAKITAMQAKLQQSKQEAKGDDSKADTVKTQQAQLNNLNVQLSQLQLEKLQAEEDSSSTSGSSSASGGASMTT
ncbi:MAG: hypothetical protein Q8S17_13135 [Humidesulfovibrio sp.]|nr:hypothetical protein [Humidesulfovibrio sp.]